MTSAPSVSIRTQQHQGQERALPGSTSHQTPGLLRGAGLAEGAQRLQSLLPAGLQQLSPPLGERRWRKGPQDSVSSVLQRQ